MPDDKPWWWPTLNDAEERDHSGLLYWTGWDHLGDAHETHAALATAFLLLVHRHGWTPDDEAVVDAVQQRDIADGVPAYLARVARTLDGDDD